MQSINQLSERNGNEPNLQRNEGTAFGKCWNSTKYLFFTCTYDENRDRDRDT